MIGIPWRLIGIGVALLVVGYGVVKITRAVSNTIERAQKYDETQRKLDDLSTRFNETVDRFTKAAADDARVDQVLTAFSARLDSNASALMDFVRSRPLTREVTHVDAKTGATVVCRERDPARFRVLYNAAVDGLAAPADPAVVP